MPTATWHNLPGDKRSRVLEVAMREFGAHGFSGGSLNVIARDAGIAKGSVFQYFTDKLDLFVGVCQEASARIRATMEPTLQELDPARPFFAFLADALEAWLAYFADHPLERGVTAATNLEMDPAVRTAVRDVATAHYLEVLRPLLAAARERGDLRPDADLDALLATLLLWLPHLALAPYVAGLDSVLGLHGRSPSQCRPVVDRLVSQLAAAYAAPTGARR